MLNPFKCVAYGEVNGYLKETGRCGNIRRLSANTKRFT